MSEERPTGSDPIGTRVAAESRSAIASHDPIVRNEPRSDSVREPDSLQAENEQVRLLREMRHDLAKLTKISAKASRRNRAHLDFLEGTKFSRRFGIALLIVIVVLMLIQILQMAGYGPGGSESGNDSTQTLQRIHTAG